MQAIAAESSALAQGQPTNSGAAEGVPLQDLGRDEAAELLAGVFGLQLQAPAGIFDELEVERFVAPDVALVGGDGPPTLVPAAEPGGEAEGSGDADSSGEEGLGQLNGGILLDSSVPLRSDTGSGSPETVDLSLEPEEGELQPRNPIVEVGIPAEIGDGIELPEIDVAIDLEGAPEERAASIIDQSVGFLPNVAPDTDFAIAPTPTGVETFTQLRSSDAPHSQTLGIDLPPGATLIATEGGGAEVVEGSETLMSVSPPTAIDATGAPVPVSMTVSGDSLILTVSFDESSSFPILVDPLFQTYEWAKSNYLQSGICNSSFGTSTSGSCNNREEWGYEHIEKNAPPFLIELDNRDGSIWTPVPQGTPGLFIETSGSLTTGDRGSMIYTVPRYFIDQEKYGERPTSFISHMTLSNLDWNAFSASLSPYLFAGLWSPVNSGWISYYSHEGLSGHSLGDMSYQYQFPNPNKNVNAKVGYVTIQATATGPTQNTDLYVGSASIELADNGIPGLASPSGPAQWINQTGGPIGFTASDTGLGVHSLTATSGANSWKTSHGCIGVSGAACPRTWKSTDASTPALKYEPSLMPQGIAYLSIVAEDPVGNKSAAAFAQVKVDHTAPTMSPLSGTATEQGSLGTKLAQYTLKYDTADGEEIAASALAPVGSAGTTEGKIERLQGIAVDASGNIWVTDRINNRIIEFDKNGNFIRQVGTPGTGNGQINEPRGIAISPNGTVWVAESGTNKRLQAFTPTGQFIRTITGVTKFSEPWGIAPGPGETLWVADQGADKLFKFKEDGTFLTAASTSGMPSGLTLTNPLGVAVDALGNVWLADQTANKVIEFNSEGKYLFSFGSEGTGNGQFKGPIGVAIAKSGHILISDDLNNRIQEFMPDGSYLRQFGSAGTGNGQFKEPRGIAVGPGNTLAVADSGNKRITRWEHADQDPQSGVTKVQIKVDGTLAKEVAPGCATKNCTLAGEWTLNADNYSVGQHQVDVIATDGVGLQTMKSLTVETHGDLAAPSIALSGTMTEQASLGTTRPTYKLKVAATDPGSAEERKSGVASTTIKVDGQVVDATAPGCPAGGCSITREWTLQSDSYSVGSHSVLVSATDAAGRTATESLTINIARDTTPPQMTTSGALVSAPEGWVEQKTIGMLALVSDKDGYGVKTVQLKIDGQLVSQSPETACEAGSCPAVKSFSVDTANYGGGAHPTEVIAIDWAGNVAKKAWTMNVDPAGQITPSEAEDTLEAVDATAESSVLTPPEEILDPKQLELGNNPSLVQSGEDIVSTGVPDTTTMTTDLGEGFSIESPEGTTLITPHVNSEADEVAIAEDVAGVAANTRSGVDSVVRPEYNGAQTFQAIRLPSSPRTFSWTVHLWEGQSLVSIDDHYAEVQYEDGHRAFLIVAEEAHDATGATVPTSLEVDGDVLTLNVHTDAASFVYPIIAGTGWETSYIPPLIVEGPEDELEVKERVKAENEEESYGPPPASGYFTEAEAQQVLAAGNVGNEVIPAPAPPASGGGGASVSFSTEKVVRPFKVCAELGCGLWWVELRNPSYHYKRNGNGRLTAYWQPGTEAHGEVWSPWYYLPALDAHSCGVGFAGPMQVWGGEGKHLTTWGRSQIVATAFLYWGDILEFDNRLVLKIWVWPNGFQQRVQGHWEVTQEWIENGGKCAL